MAEGIEEPTVVAQADSLSESGSAKPNEKKKSRRPANTAFRQQRLKAWQPILTPKTVLPLFFTIGIIFAPIGGALLYASAQVQEIQLDYTTCYTDAPTNAFAPMPSANVQSAFKSTSNSSHVTAQWKRVFHEVSYDGVPLNVTQCQLQFHIPEDMTPPVLFYYRMTNFYQNHRRYVSSFFNSQLKGQAESGSAVNGSTCTPLQYQWVNDTERIIYPCGLIANSLFNDTFYNPVLLNVAGSNENNATYEMTTNGIAWASDKQLYGNTTYSYDQIIPPPNWKLRYPFGYTETNPPPNLGVDEPFMVWMRTAALPDFSKLAMRNDTTALVAGTYQVNVDHQFPTDIYKGTKSVVISTRTVMGGRNPFLGIAYVVVGGICILLGGIFTVTHLIHPRKLGDHTYLSWNNVPGSKIGGSNPAAMASGRDFGRPGEA